MKPGASASRRLRRGLAIGLLAACVALALARILALERAELLSFDLRLRWRPGSRLRDESVRVLPVAIDEKTLYSQGPGGRYSRWPFPRDTYDDALRVLSAGGARCIGFDLRFEEARPEDPKLAAAMRRAGNVYLGARFDPVTAYFVPEVDIQNRLDASRVGMVPAGRSGRLLMKGADLPPPVLANAARAIGSLTIVPEMDGVVRRFPLVVPYVRPNDASGQVHLYASLPLLMAADMLGVPLKKVQVRLGDAVVIGDRRIPIDDSGEMVINYYGGFRTLHHLSFVDVAERRYEPRYFRGKAVLIGNTLSGGFDIQVTPYSGQYPGVEAQATVLQNILDGSVIRRAGPWAGFFLALGCSLLIGATRTRRLSTQFAASAGAAVLLFATSFALLALSDLWIELVRPLLAILIAFLLVSFDTYNEAQWARARVEGAVRVLGEINRAVACLRGPAELRQELERSIGSALGSPTARIEIQDAEALEQLRLLPGTLPRTPDAAGAPTPLVPTRAAGSIAIHTGGADADPALLNALTMFCGLMLDNAALSEEIRGSFFGLTVTLADIIESKDRYTAGHCTRVMEYATVIGERMGLNEEELEQLRYGALLHDVGKIVIPENVLNKPGRLSHDEMAQVRQHPGLGHQWLHHTTRLSAVREMVGTHHEWWDGRGYPNGIAGERIPLGGRILAVADVWDALTTDRPYRDAMTVDQARTLIERGIGTQFDPRVVDVFLTWLDERQVGGAGRTIEASAILAPSIPDA